MPRVSPDSVESRIIELLKKQYPITIEEVQKSLRINPKIAERAILRLAGRGYIELERLPDKTYIRLLVVDGGKSKMQGRGNTSNRGANGKETTSYHA
jgi:predicted ArsR family transcriptional regulator